jgi:hypothetical protein
LLVVLSLATAFWALGFITYAVSNPLDGDTTTGFVIIEVPLLLGGWALFRRVRGLRWRFPRRRWMRIVRQWGGVGPSARQPLPWTAARPTSSSRLSAPKPNTSAGPQVDKLELAEQSLGNTLYQLDLTRGQHQLTKEQIAAIRVLGLRASTWLNSRTEFYVLRTVGFGTAKDQLNTGVQRYTQLAKDAEGFLAGRIGLRELMTASEKLANWIEA